MIKLKLSKVFFFIVFFLSVEIASFAQGSDPVPPGTNEIPLDGGVLGLLVAGAVYGAKRIYDNRKQKSQ